MAEPNVVEGLAHLLTPVGNLEMLPGNPRRGDVLAVARSYRRFGQRKPVVAKLTGEKDGFPTGIVEAGNHQLMAARDELEWDSLAVVFVDEDMVEAEAFAIADNHTGQMGPGIDEEALYAMLSRVAASTEDALLAATGYTPNDVLAMMARTTEPEPERPASAKPKRRTLPLDAIFTQSIRPICCVAVDAGLKYGMQSQRSKAACPWSSVAPDHRMVFIDNEWHDYDHDMHVEFVAAHRPKYATTRDLLNEAQCAAAGVDYYPIGQVLDWAAEIGELSERVIVIPKYDCIDEIPEEYVLGYSIPTSHGGTNLPVEAFAGREIHLLGGSWKRQLAYLNAFGDSVVSLDNNYITNPALWGNFCLPDGSSRNLRSLDLGTDPTNPILIASAMSVGFIAAALRGFMAPEDTAKMPDGAITYDETVDDEGAPR